MSQTIRTDSTPITRLYAQDVTATAFSLSDYQKLTVRQAIELGGVIGLDGVLGVGGSQKVIREMQGKRGIPELYVTGSTDNDAIEARIFALDEFRPEFGLDGSGESMVVLRHWITATFTIGATTGLAGAALSDSVRIADTCVLGTATNFGKYLEARYTSGWRAYSPTSAQFAIATCMDLADRSGILVELRNTTAARACNAWARVAT